MPVIETLILLFGLCTFSGVAIYGEHQKVVEAQQKCENSAVQVEEKKQ